MSEVFGIDVSHYQKSIDWKKVSAQGIKFAIMKCQYEAQSHRIDETFENNYRGAGIYGIARGVYIFIGTQSIADPVADKDEDKHEYCMQFADMDSIKDMDAVILAVSHDEFSSLTIEDMAKFYSGEHTKVLLDIKGLLNRKEYENAGYIYWRL